MSKHFSEAINQFLTLEGKKVLKITGIPKEASSRNYYRIQYESGQFVLCVDENFTTLPYTFLEVQKFLKQNKFPVPEIIRFDTRLNTILLIDSGEKDLTAIEADDEYVLELKKSIGYILKLQELTPISLIAEKSFHYEKLMFEVDYTCSGYSRFKEAYNIDINISGEMYGFLQKASEFLAEYEKKVICHRDYHARNILLDPNGNQTIIDFQDMMMGTPQYDLTSLLYDAYRPLALSKREELYQYFKEQSPYKTKRFREYYLTQALQRSFKALGTYFVQYHDKKKNRFKESISKALENLIEICQLGRFPDHLYLFFCLLSKNLLENQSFQKI